MPSKFFNARGQQGFTLIEVLVSILILAVGLMGLAGMNSRILTGQFEAYQRAQASLLVQDMVNRIRANPTAARAGAYDGQELGLVEVACDEASAAHSAAKDLACWNESLRGVSVSDSTDTLRLGSIVGARGCIENLSGSATSEVVMRVTLAWQGLTPTLAPPEACGAGEYGDDALRRTVSVDVSLAYLGE